MIKLENRLSESISFYFHFPIGHLALINFVLCPMMHQHSEHMSRFSM
jgi:hypothetical protein